MGNMSNFLTAKAGGLADVSAALVSALFEQGADVHIAIPDYRKMFGSQIPPVLAEERRRIRKWMPDERVHMAEDRAFFYLSQVYSSYGEENLKMALAFQREVINHILPHVQPDLIHCNDWMTGLVPAAARQLKIPCLFTIHNIHTVKCRLSYIEDRGVDAAQFWHHLYYEQMAGYYEETRESNPVDLLASGIFAAHFVNTVSPTFLQEIIAGRHAFADWPVVSELSNKYHAGCAVGILNAPDPSFKPEIDHDLAVTYSPKDHDRGKKKNKIKLQETFGLVPDDGAPVFFWPHRLDHLQKGCQLLANILYDVTARYQDQNLQVVFIANGEFKKHFIDIARFHHLTDRIAVAAFDERLARLAYGASDFIFMPSLFEPCGLPQMIGPIYGALPVAHDTGGIHDTITHLNIEKNEGNGFLFQVYDSPGLFWAIDEAMHFYNLPRDIKNKQIERIMDQSATQFTHEATARCYIDLYEKMLDRPLIS
jgi:starch synthase/alpha-amylase